MNCFSQHLKLSVGKQLKDLREKGGYSRSYLAEELNYSYYIYGLKENGLSPITIDDLVNIADFFKIHPSDILSLAEQHVLNRSN